MEEKKIVIDGLSINCKTFGRDAFSNAFMAETVSDGKVQSGKLILILHGWGVGSRSWVEAGESLAKSGFGVIIPDLPGFGQSQEPKTTWDFEDYINFIEHFVAQLKLDKFNLVGHSFGGSLAAKFTSLHPEMVEKLVLCDAAIIRRERLDWRQTYAKKMASWKNRLLELPFAGGIYPFAKKILYKFAGNRDYELASPIMKEIFKNIIKADVLEATRKILAPTLIVWGDKDKETPASDAYEISHRLINSKLIIISGAGHKLHRTHNKELAEIICKFIK